MFTTCMYILITKSVRKSTVVLVVNVGALVDGLGRVRRWAWLSLLSLLPPHLDMRLSCLRGPATDIRSGVVVTSCVASRVRLLGSGSRLLWSSLRLRFRWNRERIGDLHFLVALGREIFSFQYFVVHGHSLSFVAEGNGRRAVSSARTGIMCSVMRREVPVRKW